MSWAALVPVFGGMLSNWFASRQKISEAKTEAKIKAVSEGIPGYRDEYLVLVWSYPFVGAFVPGLQDSVSAGFAFLESVPDWYVGGFMAISGAVFGIDKLLKFRR